MTGTGSDAGAAGRDPGRGAGHLPPLPADPDVPGARLRGAARYPRPHLLQVGARQPGRQSQAEHGARAGLRQQAGGREAAGHRDRRGPVGQRARLRVPPDEPRVHGLHGQGELRPEAVSTRHDEDLRRGDRRQPVTLDRSRSPDSGGRSRLARQPGHRDLGSHRGRGQARRHEVRARQRPQSRPAAPDDHRSGSEEADGTGRRLSRHSHRLSRRRQQLRGPDLPLPEGQAERHAKEPARDRRRTVRLPQPHARRARLRLRRHGRDDPPCS